ncbi:MAG: thioredoxin family protein [Anaerolineae bacterium]|nr:thioredoxin family protein [Anaerolineae bacterium]
MLEIGKTGPDFSLPGVDGQTHNLSGLLATHQAVVVIFSCNHCPYVRAWESRMIDIQRDYQDKGVILVAVGANDTVKYPDDSFENMKAHAQEMGFNFLYVRDESQAVTHAYGATHTPHVFLLDSAGVLIFRGAIDDNYDDPGAVKQHYLRDALDAVLSGQTPAITTSNAVGCTIKWK